MPGSLSSGEELLVAWRLNTGEPESVVKKHYNFDHENNFYGNSVGRCRWGYNCIGSRSLLGGNQQAVDHENAIQSDKDQHDAGLNSPVDIHSSLPLAPWKAWVSNETIAVDPEITDEMGFPGDDHAVHTGRPTDVADGKTQYRSSFSFDITGKSNTTIRAQAMRAVIDANDPPTPSATFMYYIPQGDTLKGQFIIDLGSKNLDALAMDDDGHATDQRYLDARELTVANMESVGFQGIAAAPSRPGHQVSYRN